MKKLILPLLLAVFATFNSLHVFGQLSGYYQQDFEGTFPPEGWQVVNVLDQSYGWQQSPYTVYSGNHSVYVGSAIGQGEDWLILPQFTVLASDSFSFWLTAESLGFTDSTEILVSTTNDNLSSFTTTIATLSDGVNYPSVANLYQYYAYSLSAFAGQGIYVAFRNRNYEGDGVYIDLVSIGSQLGTGFTQSSPLLFDLLAYPNPSANTLYVNLDDPMGTIAVEVFDLTGNQIYFDKSKSGNPYQINVQQWKSGTYILRVTNKEGNSSIVKWIKQ